MISKLKNLAFGLILLLSFPCMAQLSNTQIIVLSSQALTATTVTSATYTNNICRGGHFITNITSWTSGTYTVHIQAQDPASLNWYDLLYSPALSGTGSSPFRQSIYPNAAVQPNISASDFLPYYWRVQLIGASTPSMTLSVGINCED